jgi:hypothetical protein
VIKLVVFLGVLSISNFVQAENLTLICEGNMSFPNVNSSTNEYASKPTNLKIKIDISENKIIYYGNRTPPFDESDKTYSVKRLDVSSDSFMIITGFEKKSHGSRGYIAVNRHTGTLKLSRRYTHIEGDEDHPLTGLPETISAKCQKVGNESKF